MWPNKVLIKHYFIHTHLSESLKWFQPSYTVHGCRYSPIPQRECQCRHTAHEIWPLQSTWPSLHLLLSSVLDQSRGCGPGFGTWEGFDVSAVFIPVSGSLCSLSIMEEAISPASRPHHKNVSWYKETRWIITRQDSRCTPPPSPPSLTDSLCLPNWLSRLFPPPSPSSLSLSFRCYFFPTRAPLCLSLSALTLSLSRRFILCKVSVWLYAMPSKQSTRTHTHKNSIRVDLGCCKTRDMFQSVIPDLRSDL